MSRPDWVYWGNAPLKPETTPADVIATVRRVWGPEGEQLPLEVDQPDKSGNWNMPEGWDGWGDMSLSFHAGEVHYSFTGQWTWDFEEQFEAWLEQLYPLTAGGWESREGDEDDQDEEVMVFRGPSERAIAEERVRVRKAELEVAQCRYEEALKDLQ